MSRRQPGGAAADAAADREQAGEAAGAPAGGRESAGETVGFIDIGTNSVRLMVVSIRPDHSWVTLTAQKEPARLGEGEFGGSSRLQPAAMDRAVEVCRRFAELARTRGAGRLVAVATAATREAGNQSAFVQRLRDEAGLDVHVVSGKEEARLIFLGVLSRVDLDERRALVIDIGGGSTEVALGGRDGPDFLDSLSLGAIRLTNELLLPDDAGPVSGAAYDALRRRVRAASVNSVRELKGRRIDVTYGTSGTIRNLATVAVRALHEGAPQRIDTLSRADLRKVIKLLRSLPLEERRAVPGLNPARADIVIGGAAILETLMEELALAQIEAIAECGLREGLLIDHLARGEHRDLVHAMGVRERSVLQLARTTGFDEAHARRVTALALELFDSSRAGGLHRYGAAERELLEYAALLHDVGTFLSYDDHHLHTYYLVRHADLLGFDQEEVAVVAATALFHRKSPAGGRHEAYRELDRDQRRLVRLLSTLLRLAEHLDRAHAGAVAHAWLSADGPRTAFLEVEPAGDWKLERWGLENRSEAIEKSLRRTLSVRERG